VVESEPVAEFGVIQDASKPAFTMYRLTVSAAACTEQGDDARGMAQLVASNEGAEAPIRVPSRAASASFCFRFQACPKSTTPIIKNSIIGNERANSRS